MKCYSVPYEGNQEYIFLAFVMRMRHWFILLSKGCQLRGFAFGTTTEYTGDDWPEVIAHILVGQKYVLPLFQRHRQNHIIAEMK